MEEMLIKCHVQQGGILFFRQVVIVFGTFINRFLFFRRSIEGSRSVRLTNVRKSAHTSRRASLQHLLNRR